MSKKSPPIRLKANRMLFEYRKVAKDPDGKDGGSLRKMLRGIFKDSPKDFLNRWEKLESEFGKRWEREIKPLKVDDDGGIEVVANWLKERRDDRQGEIPQGGAEGGIGERGVSAGPPGAGAE